MRTTVDIDDDMLAVARVRARENGVSLGIAVSELIRKGLAVPVKKSATGFPVFQPPHDAPMVTDDLVALYRDDDQVLEE